jgi:hypothetical protein
MRYRRDVPTKLFDQHGQELVDEVVRHICEHLLAAAHPDDDPRGFKPGDAPLITLYKRDHETDENLVSLIGEISAEPNAPYLKPGFDPAADHPEIVFQPFEDIPAGRVADHDAYQRWITHGHHERAES